MARVIKIEAASGTPTYDILAGALKINKNTWLTQPGNGAIEESFEISGAGADATIMAAIQTLDELAELVELWHADPLRTQSVWWSVKADTETAKRALILSLLTMPISQHPWTPVLGYDGARYDVAVERSPVWEDESLTTFVNAITLGAQGGSTAIAAIKGSLPARISLARCTASSASGAANLMKVWLGIKPLRYGVSSFQPTWELNLGTQITADSSAQADANASGGTAVRCTFGNGDPLLERWKIKVDDVTATTDYNHFIGRYLILCRARADAAGTYGIQLKTGYSGFGAFNPLETTWFTDDTNYRFYALGEIQLPPHSFRAGVSAQDVRNFELRLACERVSGSGNLWLDQIILIPAEHSLFSDFNQINYTGGAYTDHMVFENDEPWAVGYDSGGRPINNLAFSFTDWEAPIEGGLLVAAAERVGLQVNGDGLIVTLQGYQRHRTHREA